MRLPIYAPPTTVSAHCRNNDHNHCAKRSCACACHNKQT